MRLLPALAAAALATSSTPVYWSARQATAAFPSTTWARAHHITSTSCSGEGGHIYTTDGTPLYRYFSCLVAPPKKPLDLSWVWLRAGSPPVVLPRQPDDLADNPLAPVPPAGFRRQYWNSAQAVTALLNTSLARSIHATRTLTDCSGRGFRYQLVGETVYRTFSCVLSGPIGKYAGGAPKFPKIVNVWLSIGATGVVTLSSREPSGIWQR